jgi:hypothetical protein
MDETIPLDWLPVMTWPYFFYKQQRQYSFSNAWQSWYIAGNGTGKTLVIYWNDLAHMLGTHPKPLDAENPLPVKVKCLVPSFDYVEDVALEKLLDPQRIIFPEPAKDVQLKWIEMLDDQGALKGGGDGWIEVGPMLPLSEIRSKKSYTKEHRGIELKNGSSLWFATSEQGWQMMRGGEQDILSSDEEPSERVFDECLRGLRHAKGGGKIIAGLTPPYEAGQGPTWTKEKVLEASLVDSDINVVNACMADNPSVTAQFIKRFSRGKTQKQIDVQIYGKYPTWGDVVHPDYQDRLWDPAKVDGHLLPNATEFPENHEVDWIMAFDWHPSKPCAAVFGWLDTDGNITIFDEIDKELAESKEIHELAQIFFQIEGQPHHRRNFRRWQDPSAKNKYNAVQRGFNAWDAFRKVGVVTSAGKNRDPLVGIDIVNQYFRGNQRDHPRIFIYERCKYLRQYLGNHYWKRGEDGIGKPDPKWSDYPICLRYMVQEIGWRRKNKRKRKLPYYSFNARKPKRKRIELTGLA